MRKAIALMMVFGLAGLFVVGCQKSAGQGSAGGRVEVVYWEKWTGFELTAMQKVVDLYNGSQDRVQVKMLSVSQISNKALVSIAGGDPPDIIGLYQSDINDYSQKQALVPLDDMLREAGITREQYIPIYWDMCGAGGHMYGLPSTPASTALHWNKDMFIKAGLDPERPPRTIEELTQYAEKLTLLDKKGRVIQAGFLPTEPGWWNWCWGYFFGGSLWDGDKRITAVTPENLKAFHWIQDFSKKYGIYNLNSFRGGFGTFDSPQNAFMAGKVAMEIQGVWMYNFIQSYNPGMKWGAAPFPVVSASMPAVTVAECDVLTIPAGAPHVREAFDFIRFVNTQKVMEQLCLGQRKFTPLMNVSREFLADHPNPYIKVFIDLAKSKGALTTPSMNIWHEYVDDLNSAFDKIWTLQLSPEEALTVVQQRIQKKWDRELKRRERLAGAK